MRWHWAFLSFPPLPPPLLLSLSLSPSDSIYVVGRQHALLAGTLHAAVHPALVNLVHVHDHVPVHEGHLVIVGGGVVVNGPVPFLRRRASVRRLIQRLQHTSWPVDTLLLWDRRLEALPRYWEERQQQPGALVQEQDHSGSSGNWQVADNQLEKEQMSIRNFSSSEISMGKKKKKSSNAKHFGLFLWVNS